MIMVGYTRGTLENWTRMVSSTSQAESKVKNLITGVEIVIFSQCDPHDLIAHIDLLKPAVMCYGL